VYGGLCARLVGGAELDGLERIGVDGDGIGYGSRVALEAMGGQIALSNGQKMVVVTVHCVWVSGGLLVFVYLHL
jgi:hypothetical protein